MNHYSTPTWLARSAALLGAQSIETLGSAKVFVFGCGAVGSFAIEALARTGVQNFTVIDYDVYRESNINRQLFATHSSIGYAKVQAASDRILDINPRAAVTAIQQFAHAETLPDIFAENPDIVIDAVDSLNPKVEILHAAHTRGIPVFSSMGAATRIDASRIRFGRLFDSSGCPLARWVRKRLRRRGVDDTGRMWCVYSDEPRNREAILPPEPGSDDYDRGRSRSVLGSMASMTGSFGLRLAHEAILFLTGDQSMPR